MTIANGQLDASILGPVGQDLHLRKDAAEAYNAMRAQIQKQAGYPLMLNAAYRTLAKQQDLYNGYIRGLPGYNLAAHPGTSNHGWGMAIDLRDAWTARGHVDRLGAPFGWSKTWSDAPGENWHICFRPEVWRQNRAKLIDPFAPLLDDEKAWLRRYLQLRENGGSAKDRRPLWHKLRVRRRDIWRRAQKDGWETYRRRERYAILRRYIGG